MNQPLTTPYAEDFVRKLAQCYPADLNAVRIALARAELGLYHAELFVANGVKKGTEEREALQSKVDTLQVNLDATKVLLKQRADRLDVYENALEVVKASRTNKVVVAIVVKALDWQPSED